MRNTTIFTRMVRWAFGASVAGCLVARTATAQAQPVQEAYTWRNVQIVGGGYVPGIVFNEVEPGLVYARTDIGGAYRQNPVTRDWVPLTDWIDWDHWGWTGVASLATDPVEPDRLYLAVGGYTNAWDPNNGAILRSLDRGATWETPVPLPFKLGGNMPGRSLGERLAIDPNDNSILFLAAPNEGESTGSGLWRSGDYGLTWSEVPSFPAPGTYVEATVENDPWDYLSHPAGVVWVTFDPRTGGPGSATQTIYVGLAEVAGQNVYRSTDGGSTWEGISPVTGLMPHHGVLASTGMLYVPFNNQAGPYDGEKGEVWRYDTNQDEWTEISPVPSDSDDDYFGYGGIAVDAQQPDTVMVAAFNSWWPDTILWRSLDGGVSWTKIWDWTRYPNRSFRYVQDVSVAPWLDLGVPAVQGRPSPEVSPKLGWMVGDLEIDPFDSDRMMYGTGATVYGCTDLWKWDAGGQITIEVMARGIEETAVLDLASPPSGAPLISALGDISGFRHDDLGVVPPHNHKSPNTSTTTSLDFAALNPSFMVRVGNGDADIQSAGYSTDGGASWTAVRTEPAGLTGGGTVAVNASGTRIVWSPAGTGVHVSSNNGGTWTAAVGIPQGARVGSDRVNPSVIYGFVGGTMFTSYDGGASFSAGASLWDPADGWIARFEAVPGREGEVWLAVGTPDPNPDQLEPHAGLQVSVDGGATFAPLSTVDEAYNVGFGKAAPGRTHPAVFITGTVAGIRGLFRSDDAGASWVRINDDWHQYARAQEVIIGDPNVFGRVYLGTNGRGIVYGDVCDPGHPASESDCSDGLDEDCDGPTDCSDVDCAAAPECALSPRCGDGVCAATESQCGCPADCGGPPASETACDDGSDEDCDGAADCDDADCSSAPGCAPPFCGDGLCNGAETQCVCPDDCGDPPVAEQSCSDAADEDCDGSVDCADADCVADPECLQCVATSLTVGSVTVSLGSVKGAAKPGIAEVTVLNDCGGSVANATVFGTFSGGLAGSVQGLTDATGLARLTSSGSIKANGTFTFCVDDVTGELVYDGVEACATY